MIKRKKKALLPSSFVVTQSNDLVEARYNLPLAEQRLVLTMISRIQPEDEDFKPYRISVSEFSEFLGIAKDSAYAECKKITGNLLSRVINIKEPHRLLQIGWMSSAEYVDGTGMVNLSFDPLLKPYLLQLKSNFTSCKLEMLLSFKSQYSMRMYVLLKQYEKLKEREIELVSLQEMLGIQKERYKLYADFRRFVLESVQKELKEKTDLYFEFDEIKYGRKVGAIRFRIFTKDLPCEQTSLVEDTRPFKTPTAFANLNAPESAVVNELILLVPEQHKSKKTVLSAIIEYEKKQGKEYVKRNILYSNAKSGKSYAGFLVNALKQDWGHDWQLEQEQVTATPAKKKVPEIWERQGFKSQKEYDDFMFEKQMQKYTKACNQAG